MNNASLFQHFAAGLKTRVLISLIVGEQLSSQLTILHKIVSHVECWVTESCRPATLCQFTAAGCDGVRMQEAERGLNA